MNYFIIYKGTGEKELVPEAVANAIFEAKTPKIKWKGKNGIRMIDLVSVSNIYPEEEYYHTHPDERPVTTPAYKELEEPRKKYTPRSATSALEQMIKGLKNFMANNEHSYKSKDLLEKMEKRLALVKAMPENKEIDIAEIIKF